MNVLVDTNVVSFAYKKDTRSKLYGPHLQNNLLLISFMTFAELQLWTIKHT
jgi:predicted nucleic acid-binding protein